VILVVLDLMVGLLLGFMLGSVYGAMHSIRVGMYIDAVVAFCGRVADKIHPKTRRARNKAAKLRRMKMSIAKLKDLRK